jgi:hypothetical protein
MTGLCEVVSRLEEAGGSLVLDGKHIRYRIPKDSPEAQAVIEVVKLQKQALITYLRSRAVVPMMPPGVHLISWNLKEPPVAIEVCSIVTNPDLFARTTVEQLRTALAQPGRWVGWSTEQLVDRLAQVGVVVETESNGGIQ